MDCVALGSHGARWGGFRCTGLALRKPGPARTGPVPVRVEFGVAADSAPIPRSDSVRLHATFLDPAAASGSRMPGPRLREIVTQPARTSARVTCSRVK